LRQTACSTFSRNGWSVVRSASLAKGPHLHKVLTRSQKRRVHELFKRSS
jgi:hypothetical protein